MTSTHRTGALLVIALAAGALLSACSTPAVPDTGSNEPAPPPAQEASGDDIAAAAALVQQRYDLVRDGDYEGACALYSEAYTELFLELADAVGSTCVEAHAKAAQNSDEYQATAKDQGRAGLTPFFYIPSEIQVNPASIKNDEPGLAFLGQGTVVSLDPTEFEDGTGKTPGWLAGQDYVKKTTDGDWIFISPVEQ